MVRAKATSSKQIKKDSASIYRELAAEATAHERLEDGERPLKRPRRAGPSQVRSPKPSPVKSIHLQTQDDGQTTTLRPSIDEGEDESDSDENLDFEDVEMENSSSDDDSGIDDIKVSVRNPSAEKKANKSAPRFERRTRIAAHKLHLLALLSRLLIDNHRCNDSRVHKSLRSLLSAKTRSYLKPNKTHTEAQQRNTLEHGLRKAMDEFREKFTIDSAGLRRAFWQEDADIDRQISSIQDASMMDCKTFLAAAESRSGSWDVGNQLFCALLRSADVKARLVCSLQVLPLAGTMKPTTPQKKTTPVQFAIAPDVPLSSNLPKNTPLTGTDPGAIRRRLGQPSLQPSLVQPKAPIKVRIPKLDFPIYWVEVLDKTTHNWIAIDPVVRNQYRPANKTKPILGFQPPAAYNLNQLHYVIAINPDGTAKDVTRRYAKAYNAKTRQRRLEYYNEKEWLEKVLKAFGPKYPTHVDEIEDNALDRIEFKELMPSSIQDFQGHPHFVLERHLNQNQALVARHSPGSIKVRNGSKIDLEPVYYRNDVRKLHSAMHWYRQGRVLKLGELALKFKSRKQDQAEVALYSEEQTELYKPKPVEKGIVPRNEFHNIDVFKPSMVPAKGAHINHPLTIAAAHIVGCDAVEAVTGFKFGKASGTPIIEGAVIPKKYAEAVKSVIEGLEWQETEDYHRQRSLIALQIWKKAITALRIKARIEAQYGTKDVAAEPAQEPEIEEQVMEDRDVLITAGRYHINQLTSFVKESKATRKLKSREYDDDSDAVSDATSTAQAAREFRPRLRSTSSSEYSLSVHEFEDNPGLFDGGGFLPESEKTYGATTVSDEEDGFVKDEVNGDRDASPSQSIGATTASHADHLDAVQIEGGGFLMETDTKAPSKEIHAVDSDSLMSHDPEDDDAEPDWMESD